MSDETARRTYWTEQMELGYGMVEQLLSHPVDECGETFASIPEAAEAGGVEMWFSDSKIVGDLDRVFSLRESNVADIVAIAPRPKTATLSPGWTLAVL